MPPEAPDTGENVDELLASIESPAEERAMTGGAEAEAPAAAAEPPAWDGKPWEFEWNGKKILPDSQDKAKIWMSQGYNYSQRMGELNKTHAQRQAEYDQKMSAFQAEQAKLSPYAKVDDYAKQNPQWWAKVQQDWQAAQQQGSGIDPNLAKAIQPLEEKLGKFESFLQQREAEKAQEIQQKEDLALDQEIESIRKDHPTIDLASVDPESGLTLEKRILKHASSIGTGSFKVAFRDYLHDKLLEQAKASGLEANAKAAQANAKKGILGKTPAPLKAIQPIENVKGKSWNDVGREALQELGLG